MITLDLVPSQTGGDNISSPTIHLVGYCDLDLALFSVVHETHEAVPACELGPTLRVAVHAKYFGAWALGRDPLSEVALLALKRIEFDARELSLGGFANVQAVPDWNF